MARNRVTYPTEFLFVGPSPASGYSFAQYDNGQLNDNYNDLITNHNLLKQINRVQNVGFSIEAVREEVRQLGTRSLVGRPAINCPKITIDFEYLLNGVANDARVGLNVNYGDYRFPKSGAPFYPDNFQVNLLSGLMSRDFSLATGEPFLPISMRDNRNIYLVRSPNELTEVFQRGEYRLDIPDDQRANLASTGYEVLAFGNCYLDSYQTSAAINSLPKSKVSWTSENACFYISGSGCINPAINTQTRQILGQNHFVIPEPRDEGGVSVLLPGDIQMSIQGSGFGLTGLGINFNNIFLTDYTFQMDFSRDAISSLGYKCPLDRIVTFPVICNLSLGALAKELDSGHFIDFLNQDSGFNIDIKLNTKPANLPYPLYFPLPPFSTAGTTPDPRLEGPALFAGQTAIHYSFKNAIFNGISYQSSIGSDARYNMNFSVEIDPDYLGTKGVYISGLLGIEKLNEYLIDESGNYIIDEGNGIVVGNSMVLY